MSTLRIRDTTLIIITATVYLVLCETLYILVSLNPHKNPIRQVQHCCYLLTDEENVTPSDE